MSIGASGLQGRERLAFLRRVLDADLLVVGAQRFHVLVPELVESRLEHTETEREASGT